MAAVCGVSNLSRWESVQTAAEVLMGLHCCCVEDDEGPGRPDLGDDGGTEQPGGWDGKTVEGLRHVLGRVEGVLVD